VKMHARRTTWAAVIAAAAAVLVPGSALAAAPSSTSPPTIVGTAEIGETLTATNGIWAGSPSSYAFQWQRCTAATCTNVAGATKKTYIVSSADSGRALRVNVTAANTEGVASASSGRTDVVPAASGTPANTLKPVVIGNAWVGQSLDANNGRWSGGPTSFAYQWLRCDENGNDCFAIVGATGKSYGVRLADVYSTLRVDVTAKNANGVTTAQSDASDMVEPLQPQTVAGNKAPTLKFMSLRRSGNRLAARFSVCDDSGRISVIERDAKRKTLAYVRRYAVVTTQCVTATRTWTPAPRFRTKGRVVVTLRAVDKSGRSSRFVSRSLVWR